MDPFKNLSNLVRYSYYMTLVDALGSLEKNIQFSPFQKKGKNSLDNRRPAVVWAPHESCEGAVVWLHGVLAGYKRSFKSNYPPRN